MKIVPIKLVKSVEQNAVSAEDLGRRPQASSAVRSGSGQSAPAAPDTVAFANQKLMLRGRDAGEVIAESARTNPQLLCSIANELEKFKGDRLKAAQQRTRRGRLHPKDESDLGRMLALCDAHLARIADLMHSRHSETQSGMRLNFDADGQLILNGLNISMFVESCRENPTPKARLFLKGMRSRLNALLQNKANAHNYDRLHDVISDLYEQIDEILDGPERAH